MSEESTTNLDVTCPSCGARSRPGFVVPEGQCPEEIGGHDWKPTDQVAQAGGSA